MYVGVRTSENTGVGFGCIVSFILLFFYLVIKLLQLTAWIVMGILFVICAVVILIWDYFSGKKKKPDKNEPVVWRKGY